MLIYISRNGEEFGPYELAHVQQMLRGGQLLADDFAWQEGLTDWISLSQLLQEQLATENAQQLNRPCWHVFDTINLYHTGIGLSEWQIHLCQEGLLAVPLGLGKTLKLNLKIGGMAGMAGGFAASHIHNGAMLEGIDRAGKEALNSRGASQLVDAGDT